MFHGAAENYSFIALQCIVVHCIVLLSILCLGERLKRKFDVLVTVNPATRALHVRSAVPELSLHYGLDLNSTYGSKGSSERYLLSSVLTLGPKLLHSFIIEVGCLVLLSQDFALLLLLLLLDHVGSFNCSPPPPPLHFCVFSRDVSFVSAKTGYRSRACVRVCVCVSNKNRGVFFSFQLTPLLLL